MKIQVFPGFPGGGGGFLWRTTIQNYTPGRVMTGLDDHTTEWQTAIQR